MENNKWMKGLNKELIHRILEFEPVEVGFYIRAPLSVTCVIKTGGEEGKGFAICSMLDTFDARCGKNKAAGRALRALIKKESSMPIRREMKYFSGSWTKKRMERVIGFSILRVFKSYYVESNAQRDVSPVS